MPFRCRQKMQSYAAGMIFFEVGTPNLDTGVVEFREVSQQMSLPDVEMTDLQACLKAGVNLQQKNCKLISPDSHALAERLNSVKGDVTNSNPDSKSED